MTKNIHIEHPEDSILTGDLSVLDAFLLPLLLSLKIDGSPSIVWGRNPATGCQFVGTKSVFNKNKILICETPSDIEEFYAHKPALLRILMACMAYLPITKNIYQGDFIGFGGAKNYRPNTLTYSFPEKVESKIIIAPHTKYYAAEDLRDAIAMPLTEKLESGEHVRYVQPNAFIADESDTFHKLAGLIEYAKNCATCVDFVDERTAKKIKVNLNYLIREGKEIIPADFEDAGLCSANLIELWQTVCEIKLHALDLCEDDSEFNTFINYNEPTRGEGYVMISRFGYFKLVDRSEFSYANFSNPKFAVGTA
tara:strand:- start:17 stop:943 length:927 start_codon:yes stop_codon:yes gene_type:complete